MKGFFVLFLSWIVAVSSTSHIDVDKKDVPNFLNQENNSKSFKGNKLLKGTILTVSKRNTPTNQLIQNEQPNVLIRRGKRRKKGRFNFNFGLHSSHADHINPNSFHDRSQNLSTSPRIKKNINRFRILPSDKVNTVTSYQDDMDDQFSLTVDVASAGRLCILVLSCVGAIMNASIGTLRLLAPLIVSRRILVTIGYFLQDYLRGRYFRKAYTRVEVLVLRYYELPAASRALSRATSRILILLFLARIMGWIVGIEHSPCRGDSRGLAPVCGLLWLGSVLGIGYAFSTALYVWGGPLRIQASIDPLVRSRRARIKQLFTHPGHIFRWVQEPNWWIKAFLATRSAEVFNPNILLFPVSWAPLKLFHICVMAKILSTEPCDYSWDSDNHNRIPGLMRGFLIQSGLIDEWSLVFFREKRVGLGIFVFSFYFIAFIMFIIDCAKTNMRISALFLPSILSLVISGWMNIVIFWNRLDDKKKVQILNSIPFTKPRDLNSADSSAPLFY